MVVENQTSHQTKKDILAPIRPDMARLNDVVRTTLHSEVPLVNQVAEYLINAGGKRLRPAIHLLLTRALQTECPDTAYTLAAVVEFIHTSTLLHDDVVDESDLRRGRQTANALFGNAASVLVGDFLYSRSFQMMVSVQNMRVMDILADATNVIAEGEVMQLMNIHNADLDEAAYLRVIRSKTAKLFEASARLAAILAKSSSEVEEACAVYGQALGTAFQVIDDVLDYDGDPTVMGKSLGDDLREGKATLPLIIAMQRSQPAQRKIVQNAIETGDNAQIQSILSIIRDTGALDASRQAAAIEAQRAIDVLIQFEPNKHVNALLELASKLLIRQA